MLKSSRLATRHQAGGKVLLSRRPLAVPTLHGSAIRSVVSPVAVARVAVAAPVNADVPGIETTHDENVHGTAGAVQVERPGLKRATELRNISFVTSEVAPWSKTGGLADVLGSLPFALAERGHRVMVVAPRYAPYAGAVDTGARVTLLGNAEVGFFHQQIRGVDFVFVDHPSFPRPGGLYSDENGVYGDNQPPVPTSKYGEDIMFMANDWHASLLPVYLAAKYRPNGVYMNARCIIAIHNLCHQVGRAMCACQGRPNKTAGCRKATPAEGAGPRCSMAPATLH
ncbi:Starch synthase 1, chloroplastic/amyloplastic [Tetrabaena socialis]|uniref:Starch synthase 1, chloroplastic/amyloplastic n=1 Tax=Tetrabaena socialis TaxID=47790 RepID=A0A2J7ZQ05_9CHLO|nr:Starch synthase 1, chloroplastic/amyloplastic [Tetrabaena socialis]|eukprot:PNH02354.1 Starch synthase 1, chloroplastic/amyloplastic [Tetrabaena socialis]